MNLLFMVFFLLAPDLRRAADFLVFNRPTAAAALSAPVFHRRWARIAAVSFQILFVSYCIVSQIWSGWTGYAQSHLHPKRPPIYGLYDVETFSLNGQVRPPLLTDTTRWNKVILESPTSFQMRLMDNSLRAWAAEYDAVKNTVTLSRPHEKKNVLRYSRADPDHVLIEGQLGADTLWVRLRRFDVSRYLLVSRGYHWINEFPFNR